MHINDVFSFFKNYFWHQHIKTIQNIQIILNFSKNNFRNAAAAAFPNVPLHGHASNLKTHLIGWKTNNSSWLADFFLLSVLIPKFSIYFNQ
jgi:hypothetical protein